MFRFIKKVFLVAISFISGIKLSVNPWKYISMNNQEGKVRHQILNINSDKPVFFPFSIKTSKCSGS